MPVPWFVAEVMGGYRNAHHGYFSGPSETRPLRFLFPVNGNPSNHFSDIYCLGEVVFGMLWPRRTPPGPSALPAR